MKGLFDMFNVECFIIESLVKFRGLSYDVSARLWYESETRKGFKSRENFLNANVVYKRFLKEVEIYPKRVLLKERLNVKSANFTETVRTLVPTVWELEKYIESVGKDFINYMSEFNLWNLFSDGDFVWCLMHADIEELIHFFGVGLSEGEKNDIISRYYC